MKKGLSFILAVTLIISIAGCKGDNSRSSSATSATEPSSSTPTAIAPSSSAPTSNGSSAPSDSGNTFAVDKVRIQLFLQKFFEIPLGGIDLNNLSDSDTFNKCIVIMVQNKEYSKEGDKYFFASDKINEYARMYCQKKIFSYTKSDDQFRYDADKKGFLSTLEFGILPEGPECSRTIEVIDAKIVGGKTEVSCVFKKVYKDAEEAFNNETIDYKIILEEDNSTYSIVSVNKIFDSAICGIEFGLSPEQLLQALKEKNIDIIRPKEGESNNQIENPVNDGRRYNYDGSFTFITDSANFSYNDKGVECGRSVNNVNISTNEGLKVGDTVNKMKNIYGNNYDYNQDYDCYRYYNGSQYLFINFLDNKVSHWGISIYRKYDND